MEEIPASQKIEEINFINSREIISPKITSRILKIRRLHSKKSKETFKYNYFHRF